MGVKSTTRNTTMMRISLHAKEYIKTMSVKYGTTELQCFDRIIQEREDGRVEINEIANDIKKSLNQYFGETTKEFAKIIAQDRQIMAENTAQDRQTIENIYINTVKTDAEKIVYYVGQLRKFWLIEVEKHGIKYKDMLTTEENNIEEWHTRGTKNIERLKYWYIDEKKQVLSNIKHNRIYLDIVKKHGKEKSNIIFTRERKIEITNRLKLAKDMDNEADKIFAEIDESILKTGT